MSFQVQFHWNTSFQTNYGGIISLILYIILLAAFIFLYVLLHKKEEQKINSFDLKYEVPPAFNLIFDPDKSMYSKEEKNGGFFITAFYFINKGSNTITDYFEDIVTVTFTQKKSSGNSDNDAFEKNLEYKKCSEVYKDKKLVGGLYGVKIGKCFFGESMFSTVSNASKVALISMCKRLEKEGYIFLDCQMHTNHLESMGGKFVSWEDFKSMLQEGIEI
jgi:hypothetical protein